MLLLHSLTFLLLSIVISFFGSLQLGPVNLAVIQASLHRTFKYALWISVGGCIPELFYSAAAFWFAGFLDTFPKVFLYMQWLMIPVFFIAGIYLLFKKPNVNIKENENVQSTSSPILIGFTLNILNPMLFPFWVIVIQYMKNSGFGCSDHIMYEALIILGAALGAFLLQFTLAYNIRKYKLKFKEQFIKYSNPVSGWMFIVIGVGQSIVQFLK